MESLGRVHFHLELSDLKTNAGMMVCGITNEVLLCANLLHGQLEGQRAALLLNDNKIVYQGVTTPPIVKE